MHALPREKTLYIAGLIKKCLHLGADTASIQAFLQRLQRLDTRDIDQYLGTDTRLAPLLFWHLRRRGLTSLLAEKFAAELGRTFQANVARNFLFEQNLAKILRHFNREGIEVLVLKGASVFTAHLSQFRDAFVLSDIDLMVRPADLARAAQILVSHGYSLKYATVMDGATKQSFSGADDCTAIDLHSALFWTGVNFNYVDYFPSDLWATSLADSIGTYPVRILSAEHDVCYRLAHDGLGHQTLLLSDTSRLYYLCLLIDFHRETLDWTQLLEKLKRKRTDRLLAAYAHYGKRELGLSLPPELEKFQGASASVSYLDAVEGGSARMVAYNYRAAVAALMSRNLHERFNELFRHALIPVSQRNANAGPVRHVILVLIRWSLQFFAVIYISAQRPRHSIPESKSNVA